MIGNPDKSDRASCISSGKQDLVAEVAIDSMTFISRIGASEISTNRTTL
jgi:hypothetical protein